ncbi:EAL domain-containing protein [Lentilactobacillus kosonis]|uniref:Protein containing diguanylate cyclase/phosphodiesterase domain 2 n=1 Tax=Lentilactobacillus kosonis TaxID=2810561 RepID=A0A401FM33_9LACO|nr:EAL domain-containing protein [Lentilactobacillus kosonis]GAY73442.1 protein containing diguanylate cyclase/phosphodiesterase domain 2 [Lentilactobacillus kosonis]
MYRYFIQPQLNRFTNSLIGYELLMKKYVGDHWEPPVRFADIPADIIADVLLETTKKLALKIGSVSVNLNRTQMMNPSISKAIAEAQDILRPMRVNIELTEEPADEGITVADMEPHFKVFEQRGMELCIDDVGTGENQLDRISELIPYSSEIKFALQNFDEPFTDKKIQERVKFWHQVAIDNKLRFILEGIEDQQDDEIATALEIDLRQGYYYGAPHLLRIKDDDPR